MSDLEKFFYNNEIRTKTDFSTSSPIQYEALHDAFSHYFQTFRDKKSTYHLVFEQRDIPRESLAFSHSSTTYNVANSILSFHRFFELQIKEILRRVDPILSVKTFEKEEHLLDFLDGELDVSKIKTVEFSTAFKRLQRCFAKYSDTNGKHSSILIKFDFLVNKENTDSLNYLSQWRNRLIHNGSTLPNLYAFEYLISQRILPLLLDVLRADHEFTKNYKFPYFETNTGINVIKEIANTKFGCNDFTNPSASFKLGMNFVKIGHLKELGRTAFIQLENTFFRDRKLNSWAKKMEKVAKAEIDEENYHDLKKCISCGENTLVIYRSEMKDIFNPESRVVNFWAQCFYCDYSITDHIGDPSVHKICDQPLFEND